MLLQLEEHRHIIPDEMTHLETQRSVGGQAAGVLARAVLRAAQLLGVSQKHLATVLGVSEASLSRLAKGLRQVEPNSKEGELALLFIRIFRSLDALVGGSPEKSRAWFHAENLHLNGVPAQLIRTVPGLVHVSEYLDAMRGNL
jgi:DNA-binding XRE family transcriptional regulator